MTKTMAKYEPKSMTSTNRLFPSIWNEFDSMLESPFFGGLTRSYLSNWEKIENGYRLEINLPKYKKEDVSVSTEGNMLTIEGKRENAPFYMQMSLPISTDAEKLSAKLADGVLTVIVGQLDSAKAKQIEIE